MDLFITAIIVLALAIFLTKKESLQAKWLPDTRNTPIGS